MHSILKWGVGVGLYSMGYTSRAMGGFFIGEGGRYPGRPRMVCTKYEEENGRL